MADEKEPFLKRHSPTHYPIVSPPVALRAGIESETESCTPIMIDITKLTSADIGRWVSYCILPPYRDRGRIKSWSRQFVYVVFRCGGNWDDFSEYTAAPTLPEYLNFELREQPFHHHH